MDGMKDTRSNAAAIGGLALIAFGLWWLVRSTGIIPEAVLDIVSDSVGALTLIGLGIVVLMLSRRGTFVAPRAGTRLYRSRSDRWLGGVLGGLGVYLGIDPLLLRVAVILLTVLGAGALVPAYIVMWVIVPEEPLVATPGVPIPPAPPVPGV
jgi:phage shock protein C